MALPPRATRPAVYDDAPVRARIGPWAKDGAADLSAFEADTNFFVRAAAGSGKTTSLVARMVALVRRGVPVEKLAAITFTRKAAGEMATRFFEELERTRQALPPQSAERARVEAALQNVQHAFVGTVHAFCARLLRERPLAAGLPPDFTAGLEDREERELRERAWREYLSRLHDEAPERIRAVARLGVEPDALGAYFELLCGYPDLTPYTNAPEEVPDLRGAVEEAAARLRAWQAHRPDPPPAGRDAVMRAFDRAESMLRYRDLDAPAEQAAFLECFADASDGERAKVTLKCWGARGSDAYAWARTLRDDLLPELVRTTVEPALRRWGAYVHEAVVAFTRPVVAFYQRLRRREGLLTFHDLLLHTRNLLRDRPDVREAFQQRYARLLVDEFQDTDPLQAEVLFYLTSHDPAERNWRRCTPRPGSLFIVGDDKQSIYRFRRADKEVFDAVAQLVERSGGEVVDLTKNFRSLGQICGFCDRAFAALFAEPELADVQAGYVPFDPQRPDGREGAALRRIVVGDVRWNRGEDIARRDARQIARFIRAAVAGEADTCFYGTSDDAEAVFRERPGYGDFLVLTRTKARLGIYAQTLAEHGIPYTITGSEDLGASEELKTLVDLMRCALRPDDPVAAVAYLKGPLTGCSDDDLYRYVRAGGRFDRMHAPVPPAVLASMEAGAAERLRGAAERLRRVREALRTKRPAAALDAIVEQTGLLAGAVHPPEPAEASLRGGYVLRTLAYVQRLAAQGFDWAEVLGELQRVLDGEEAVDGMTLETGSEEAVRVMNVHQAKGLQAPVVFLADPYSSGRRPPATRHVRRETRELVAPVVQGEGHYRRVTHAPLGWHADSEEAFCAAEERHEEAEERRLLYVAATRAQNLLVVSTYPKKEADGYWSALYPYLDEAGVPELRVPDVGAIEAVSAPAPALARLRAERRRRLEASRRASYAVDAVTEGGHAGDAFRLGRKAGYGEAFGIALHALFERCVRAPARAGVPSDAEVKAAFDAAGAEGGAEAVRRAQAMVEGLLASALWAEVEKAPVVYAEYPVARMRAGDPPTLVRGTIDLVYRRDDGWVVVDFKSGIVDAEACDALPPDHPYCRQVRAYAELWEYVVQEPVAAAGLWLAEVNRFVPISGAR